MNSSKQVHTAQSYNETADDYELRWPYYLKHTHRRFLEKLDIEPSDRLLDLSCGTGLLAAYVINRGDKFCQMTLNDIAARLQNKARNRLGGRDDINFTSCPADDIEYPDLSFDKIICLSAFHNYARPARVLKECRRLLKPGGQLYVLDWNRSGWFRFVNWCIKIGGTEFINTKSAEEMKTLLAKHSFNIRSSEAWYYGFWKLFYLIGEKQPPASKS